MHDNKTTLQKLMRGASVAVLAVTAYPVAASAQDTQTMETVTVTGFRGSLEKALDVKRNSATAIDSIMAEDVAKLPDLNLSEALQRVPGVTITRDAGEGRQVSVRGLGAGFTRTLVNGMEMLSTGGGTDASGGTNRTRAFDYNAFEADLFKQLSVEKTAAAETQEGSLGSTVYLYTPRPFDMPGFHFTASAKGEYNALASTTTPRFGFLVSDTFLGGRFGVLLAGGHSDRELLDEGFSTVRWAGGSNPIASGFRSVSGVTYNGAAVTKADFNTAASTAIFHPKIPRLDKYTTKQHRTGFAGSVQWQPEDGTLFTLDGLYSIFGGTRDEEFLETFTFQQSGACTSTSAASCGINQVDITGGSVILARDGVRQLVTGTFNNVDLKSEHRHDKLSTETYQFTLHGEHDFGTSVRVKGMIGYNNSLFANPIQNDVFFDQYNVQNYAYDFTGEFPLINYGTGNVTDPAAWTLTEIRENPNWVYNRGSQAQISGEWDITKQMTLKGGVSWTEFNNHAVTFSRSDGTNSNRNYVLPTTLPVISDYSMLETFDLPGMPSGNVTKWLVPDMDKAAKALHLFDTSYQSTVTDQTTTKWVSPFKTTCFTTGCGIYNVGPESASMANNYTVQENDLSGYLQLDFKSELYGLPVRGNFGTRVVQTRQSALGYGLVTTVSGGITTQTIQPTTNHRTYTDVLPSFNLAIEPSDSVVIRWSGAKVMSRPTLGNINPGIAINTNGNKTVSAGNPDIKPFRAKTMDLAIEWYFSKGGLISIGAFYKDISTFVQSFTSTNSVFSANPWGLPNSQATAACGGQAGCDPALAIWAFTYPINTPGGPLTGAEFNYQQPLDFLPGPFEKMGFIGNLTYVDSKISYMAATSGVLSVSAVNKLTNLSNLSWNTTLYYEDGGLMARISAAFRSKYLTRVPGRDGSDVEGTNGTINLDASLSYAFGDNWTATLEGVNLTNTLQEQFFDSSNMLSYKHMTGREVLLGVRFNY
jgi:iron complex outermembrane recepter protein